MNAAALALAPGRRATSYAAWRITAGRTDRLPLPAGPATLAAALQAAAPLCLHKDQLLIRERDEAAAADTLHLYAIRKARPAWVRRGFETVREAKLYPGLLCTIDAAALA
jgi:hypothetical protein